MSRGAGRYSGAAPFSFTAKKLTGGRVSLGALVPACPDSMGFPVSSAERLDQMARGRLRVLRLFHWGLHRGFRWGFQRGSHWGLQSQAGETAPGRFRTSVAPSGRLLTCIPERGSCHQTIPSAGRSSAHSCISGRPAAVILAGALLTFAFVVIVAGLAVARPALGIHARSARSFSPLKSRRKTAGSASAKKPADAPC